MDFTGGVERTAFYISIEKKGVWGYGRKIKALWI
jgi:hypothetical protein